MIRRAISLALFATISSGCAVSAESRAEPAPAPAEPVLQVAGESPLRLHPRRGDTPETLIHLSGTRAINAGRYYRISYEMRTIPDAGTSVGQAGVELTLGSLPDEGTPDREQIERQSVSVVGEEWESFVFTWQAQRDYAPGEFRLQFRPAYFQEMIELRSVEVREVAGGEVAVMERSGYSYPGQEADAAWRSEADARIRAHRMADLQVRVVDEWGKPLPEATIEVTMTRHEYLFGTCVNAARITDADFIPVDPEGFDPAQWRAENATYRSKLKELFNFAVFENDMKWPNWSGRHARRGLNQEVTMDAVAWLQNHDFAVKSHTMLWGSWRQSPAYLKERENDPEALREAIRNHLADQAGAFRGKVAYADVLNEALSHNNLIEIVGWDQVGEWFKAVKAGMPETRLVINEFDILGNGGSPRRQDDHAALVERLLAEGAPVDVLGFQSHFWSTRLTPPDRLYAIIDRFAGYGLPLMVSEFDMNILDEALQADYTRDFLKVWFSHPATEAYIMWGFWAKAHWFGEPGAMFRADWSPKPNLAAYTDLVFGEWWTRDTLTSDADGTAAARVFKGDYEITISAPGRHTAIRRPDISDDGCELIVVLYPDEAP